MLAKEYPNIFKINTLRILTIIEINYIVHLYIDLINVSLFVGRKVQPWISIRLKLALLVEVSWADCY